MLDTLQAADFARHLGQTFRVHTGAGEPAAAELIQVDALDEVSARGGQRAPFSLLFRAPVQVPWSQRIFRVEHEVMGVLEIFLVPIGSDEAGMRLEAVFT